MIKVSALMFAAAAKLISTDECRYYLCGVNVEPCHLGGALLVATDGHRLICIHDPNGECTKSAIIKLGPEMLTACAPQTTDWRVDEWDGPTPHVTTVRDRILLVSDDGIAEIGGALRQIEACTIDGTFPEWRKTIPAVDKKAVSPQTFNGHYLAAFGEIAALLGDNSHAHIRVVGNGATPAIVFFPNSPNAFGILMPVKHDGADELPPFAKRPEPAVAA